MLISRFFFGGGGTQRDMCADSPADLDQRNAVKRRTRPAHRHASTHIAGQPGSGRYKRRRPRLVGVEVVRSQCGLQSNRV